MRSLNRFSQRAEDYSKYRPNYPDPAIETILHGLGNSASLVYAADIGAGTGIASRQLGDRNIYVKAVEPDSAMRQAASPIPWWSILKGQQKRQVYQMPLLT
jgi:hypothetical protein